jgi:hypothetical protein
VKGGCRYYAHVSRVTYGASLERAYSVDKLHRRPAHRSAKSFNLHVSMARVAIFRVRLSKYTESVDCIRVS